MHLDARILTTALGSQGRAANGDKHGVVLVRLHGSIAGGRLPRHLDLAARELLNRGRDASTDEFGPVLHHVVADTLGGLLVKAAKGDGAHHDGGVVVEAGEEAGALEGNVGSTHDEGLAGSGLHREEVVRGDAALLLVLQAEVLWPASRGNNDLVGRRLGDCSLLVLELDCVGIDELGVGVEVLDALFPQLRPILEVERADVVLRSTRKRGGGGGS